MNELSRHVDDSGKSLTDRMPDEELTNDAPGRPSGGSACPICKGAGFVRRDLPPDHPDFGRAIPCRCKRKELVQRRQEQLQQLSNLGMLRHQTFDTFRPEGLGLNTEKQSNLQHTFDACRRYARTPEGWLILIGGYGCGKTHLAAAIANARLEQNDEVLFVVVPDLLDHLRATFNPTSPVGYDERFEQVRTTPLLILDDLGTHAATPWAQEKLFQIVNYRYNAELPTVITTNHDLEEIDVRIRSRLVDPAISKIITILAPDYRQSGVDQGQSDLSSLGLLQEMTFQTFDKRSLELQGEERERLWNAYKAARRFADTPSGWFVLVGPYGVGKTHLAAAIANERVASGHSALFVVVPDLLDHLRATFSPNSLVRYDKRFEQVRRTSLLVLDDLGTHSATPWAEEKLFQLFNYRYMARLPTVITLNAVEDVEPRLLERMMEMKLVGHGSLIELRIPPYRGRGTPSGRPGSEGQTGKRRTS